MVSLKIHVNLKKMVDNGVVVSYLGPKGTYSYFAAIKKFGPSVKYTPVRGIDIVFKDVDSNVADYGIVPVENSTEGGIRETLNMFAKCDVKICSEIVFPIHHNLMVNDPAQHIKTIYSKPQVFGQCRDWLSKHFSEAELVDMASSAEAANIAKERANTAAIAHVEVAGLNGLTIVYSNIEDNVNNITRFFVLSQKFPAPGKNDKTVIMCYIKNRVGGLFDILKPFKDYGINLTNIEPLSTRKTAWDYGFYLDFEGSVSDSNVDKAISEVKKNCVEIKILGSFPRANI